MWCNFTFIEAKLTWWWRNWSSFFLLPSCNDFFPLFILLWKWLFIAGASRYAMFLSVVKLNQLNDYNFFFSLFASLSHTLWYQFSLQNSHKKALQNLAVLWIFCAFFLVQFLTHGRKPSWSQCVSFWKLSLLIACTYCLNEWISLGKNWAGSHDLTRWPLFQFGCLWRWCKLRIGHDLRKPFDYKIFIKPKQKRNAPKPKLTMR